MELKEKIEILFFDIDFTAFDHNHFKVRPLTLYALKELKKKGYKICISTSRGKDELRWVDKEFIELADALICLAGAYVVINNDVNVKPINKDLVRQIIMYLDSKNIPYRYATTDGKGYLSQTSESIHNLFYKYYHMVPDVKKYEGEEVLQLMYYDADESIHNHIRAMSNDIEVTNMKYNNEISLKTSNKGDIIKEVCSLLKVDPSCAMSFGDSENDIALLKKSYFGVAMGNACDELKQIADYVCEEQDKDGIYNTFVKYGFIDKHQDKNKEVFEDIKNAILDYSKTQINDIDKIAGLFVNTIKNNGIIQLYGPNKHEQFCQELYYRAGGLVYFHKILNPSVETIEKNYIIDQNDMFVMICDSGNEKEAAELAKYAKNHNHKVILIAENKDDTDKELYDQVFYFNNKNKPHEYTLNNTFAQLLNIKTYTLLKENGIEPLLFLSNNLENSKKHNEDVLKIYEGRIL